MIKIQKVHNGRVVEITPKIWKFPVGEIGVQLDPDIYNEFSSYFVTCFFESNDDIFILLNIVDALRNLGIDTTKIYVQLPYLPYSRQDRVCKEGESFALKVMLKVLDTMEIRYTTWDIHSDAYKDLTIHLLNTEQQHLTDELPLFDILVGPDKGSSKKISKVAEATNTSYTLLHKERTSSGIQIKVLDSEAFIVPNMTACIVDDLGDGCMTFIKAAEAIKEVNPTVKLSLYVTHGFFTAGIDKLKEMFDNVYCKFLYSKDPAVKAFVKEI